MNATRKSRSPLELFKGFGATLRGMFSGGSPRAYIDTLKQRLQDLPMTNYQFGCDMAEQGKWQDAIFRFKLAIRFKPDFIQAYYNLGCCYMRVGRREEAKAAFRKTLSLMPNHADAIFMLSALDERAVPENMLPRRMPKEMVTGFFEPLAGNFDAMEQGNNYNGPRIMFDALKPYAAKEGKLHVVDLGCGTGLCARPWRSGAAEMTGLDFTPAMAAAATAARAGDAPLFERVLQEDLSALPENVLPANATDVVIACNVAQFVGELSGMMKAVAATLKTGGVFGITIEPFGSVRGFSLNPDTGRFGHTPEYVKQVAAAAGLQPKRDGRVNLYPSLQAHLLIFAKEAA